MVSNCTSSSIGRTGRIILVVAFSVAAAASAKAAQGTAEQRAACTPDAMRLCSSEIPDVARVTACMKAKQASLSARCRAMFASASTSESASLGPKFPAQYRRLASGSVFSYGSHHHRMVAQHRWARSGGALRAMRQVIAGFAMACGSGTMPADFCNNMSGSFLQSGMLSSGLQSGMISSGLQSGMISSGLLSSGFLSSMAP